MKFDYDRIFEEKDDGTLINMLLKEGLINVDTLCHAVQKNRINVVSFLLVSGVKIDSTVVKSIQTQNMFKFLHDRIDDKGIIVKSLYSFNTKLLRYICTSKLFDRTLNKSVINGYSLASDAIYANDIERLKLVLTHFNISYNNEMYDLIITAEANENEEMLELLVKHNKCFERMLPRNLQLLHSETYGRVKQKMCHRSRDAINEIKAFIQTLESKDTQFIMNELKNNGMMERYTASMGMDAKAAKIKTMNLIEEIINS